jgi:hypothetical protein
VIHNPSDHAMRGFPTHFRMPMPWDIKGPHTERICPHGVGHPDPDDYEYWLSRGQNYGVHGCDGCCRPDTAEQCGEVCAAGGGDVAVCQREKGHPPGECSSGKADEMARDMFAGMLPEWT